MPTTRAYEIVWSGVLAGQFVQTVQHMQASEAADAGAYVTALNIISPTNFDDINEAFMGCLPASYQLTSVRCRRVFPAGGPTAVVLANNYSLSAGQRAADISAAQVNPVVLWIAGTLESRLGKLFLPGVAEDDIDNMALAASLLTDIQIFINAWIAGFLISADNYSGSIATRSPSSPYNVTAVREILYGQVSPLIGTQRRRLRPV
jgi:hypothetical protein